mgnify:FL=1
MLTVVTLHNYITHMDIVMFYGSRRKSRLGIRAVNFVRPMLEERGYTVTLLDANEIALPILEAPYHHLSAEDRPRILTEIGKQIDDADGFVIVAGEYNHSIQPGLSNLIDHFYDQYAYKPAVIVSYSYGMFAGVRAEVQLRALLGEVGMTVIQKSLPIPKISDNLGADGSAVNERMPEFAAPVLDQFDWFVSTLAAGRKRGTPDS